MVYHFSPDFISHFCYRFSNEYTVKDSFSLAEELSNVDADLVMTSFDIKRYLPISHWENIFSIGLYS